MAADRRIDAAGGIGHLREQRLVERLAHAVQALELVALDTAGFLDHRRDRERVVGGELRKQPRPRRQQFARSLNEAQVGHRLAGEHRIVGKPALLRALHLGVPVGALHQPHHQPAVEALGRLRQPVDDRGCALLVRLHGEAEAVPIAQRSDRLRTLPITSIESSSRSASSASTVKFRS